MDQRRHTTDVCVVGAGMAGLYSALRILRRSSVPTVTVTVLEAADEVGGRVSFVDFAGMRVPAGAGITRSDHSIVLKTMKTLGVKERGRQAAHLMAFSPKVWRKKGTPEAWMKDAYRSLLSAAEKMSVRERYLTRFEAFSRRALGEDGHATLVLVSGYTDYLSANVQTALYHALPEMLQSELRARKKHNVYFDVEELKEKLCEAVLAYPNARIVTGSRVHSVVRRRADAGRGGKKKFRVKSTSVDLECDRVVLATTASEAAALVPDAGMARILRHANAEHSYLRVYASIDRARSARFEDAMTGKFSYMVSSSPLRKIIPMDRERGIYMVSYCDGDDARRVNAASKSQIQTWLSEEFGGVEVKITGMRKIFWETGTHTLQASPEAYKIANDKSVLEKGGLVVVGEGVAVRHQQWMEGAFESVERLL